MLSAPWPPLVAWDDLVDLNAVRMTRLEGGGAFVVQIEWHGADSGEQAVSLDRSGRHLDGV